MYVHALGVFYVHALGVFIYHSVMGPCCYLCLYMSEKKLPPTNHAIDYLAGWWGE